MRADRPSTLAELRTERMHPIAGKVSERAKASRDAFEQARDFRRAATSNLAEGLRLPGISALYESARLAVTASAAADGFRFRNTVGAHEAVVDYAFATLLVDRQQWAQLDQLRDLRHHVNYPADLIAPSTREIEQFSELVDTIFALVEKQLPPRRIPPPPK